MKKLLTIVSSLVLTASLINAETVDIHSGWNLLGTGAQDINVSATFADKDISLVWGYRNIQKDWVAASPNGDYTPEQLVANSSVQEYFQSVPAHMGYWVKSENTQSQAVEIIYVDSLSIEPAPSTTGLIWQDDEAAATTQLNWQSAIDHCADLNLAGSTDWRLPTIEELESIVDTSNSPTIKAGFENTFSSTYWSSTTYAGNTDFAWSLHFGLGLQGNGDKSFNGFVRCVRAGQ